MTTESKRSQHEKWFKERRGPRNPQDEAELLAVADAYDAAQRSGRLSKQQLQVVVEGASSPRGLVWNGAADLLKLLAERFGDASQALVQMSNSPKAHVRFCALCCLGKKTPTETVHALIKAGLTDKSSQVRWKAADRAHSLQLVELVPEITAAFHAEKHAKTRSTIEFELRLLRDGYILEQCSDRQFLLTVSYHPGGFRARYISNKEMKAEGIDAIVAKMRNSKLPG